MINRALVPLVHDRLAAFPAVALVGPRQCGKTTLAKALGGLYYDLESSQDRLRLEAGWEDVLASKKLLIFDEAQTWPELFPLLRSAIDLNRKKTGRFLLLGSVSPALMKHVSDSLAGRLALLELTPLLLGELKDARGLEDALWLYGGYPDGGILKKKQFPHWQTNYLTLLAQRDLPSWGLPAKPHMTQRLFLMLAATHAQMWNASHIARALGLDFHTVQSYLDYLINVFLIRSLPSFQRNVRKRITKSPKVYWRDSGLLHALLDTPDKASLLNKSWLGYSWEGWIIEQVLSALQTRGKSFQASYLRSVDGHEIDLILEFGKELWAIEIKLSSIPTSSDIARLHSAADLVGATKRVLLSRSSQSVHSQKFILTNLRGLLKLFSV